MNDVSFTLVWADGSSTFAQVPTFAEYGRRVAQAREHGKPWDGAVLMYAYATDRAGNGFEGREPSAADLEAADLRRACPHYSSHMAICTECNMREQADGTCERCVRCNDHHVACGGCAFCPEAQKESIRATGIEPDEN